MDNFEIKYKKSHKRQQRKQFYRKHKEKFFKIVFFYIYYPLLLAYKISERRNKKLRAKNQWSLERAKEFCDEYLPKYCEFDDKNNEYYFFNNGYGFPKLKHKDKLFAKLNRNDILRYICDTYEIAGYEKEVLQNYTWDSGAEVCFKKIKENDEVLNNE